MEFNSGFKIVKNPGNGRLNNLNNLNDPVLNVLICRTCVCVQSGGVHEVIACHCSPILVYDRYQTAHVASLTAHSTGTLTQTIMRYRILRVDEEISSLIWILKFHRYYKSLRWLLFCARCIHCAPSDTP